jgi:hypothetical protein
MTGKYKYMQATYRARYRAKNLEEVRRRDREAKRLQRQRQKELSASQVLPMGEFEGLNTSHLYLMRYEFDPRQTLGIKVGRSENVSNRKLQLEEGHSFQMKILRVYPGCGSLEGLVHKLLATKRLTGGSSREWFDVSFDTAMLAVSLAKDLYDSAVWRGAGALFQTTLSAHPSFSESETASNHEEIQSCKAV